MDRRFSLAGLGVLIAGCLAVTLLVVTPTISLDDPFIGLRYATNLLAGEGLVYNPGEYVEGYTAFGWVMVGALGMALGVEPLAFWQVWLVAAQAVTLIVLWLLGRRSDRPAAGALIAPALLAFHVAFAAQAMMGMSAVFVTMLVTLSVLLVDRGVHRRTGGAAALGVVLLVLCLTRFDGLILAGIVTAPVLLDLVVRRRQPRPLVPLLLILGVGLAAFNAWRLWYYGGLLPNTFHVKVTSFTGNLEFGLQYLKDFARHGGPYVLLGPLLPIVLLSGRANATTKLATWVAGMHLLYVLVVGGDWMPAYRFIVPVLPLLALVLQESLWALHDLAAAARWTARIRDGALLGAVALVLAVNVLPLLRSRYVRAPGAVPEGAYFVPTHAKRIGEHLDERLPPDALVATEWAGIIPFYMRQPVFDVFGLSDPEIASTDYPGGRMGRQIPPEMVIERAPDMVIYAARIYGSPGEAGAGIDLRRGRDPDHPLWIHWFYGQLADDPFFENCIVKIGDGYWPVLVRADWSLKDELCFRRIP